MSTADTERIAELQRLVAELAQRLTELAAHTLGQPAPATPPATLLTVRQAAEDLAISRSQVFALIKTGELASIKIGAARRVPKQAIRDYVAQRSHPAEPDRQSERGRHRPRGQRPIQHLPGHDRPLARPRLDGQNGQRTDSPQTRLW